MNDSIDLRQYIAIGLKWWWLVALMTVVAGATGYFYSTSQPPVYQASSTIIVGQSIQSTDLSSADILTSERLGRTYAEIALQPVVLQAVVERLSLQDSWQSLRSRVSLSPVRDTQLLQITVGLQQVIYTGQPFGKNVIQIAVNPFKVQKSHHPDKGYKNDHDRKSDNQFIFYFKIIEYRHYLSP